MIHDRLESFKKWLQVNGAEIQPLTNEYEILRFKGSRVGVVYSSGKTNGDYADHAYSCFSKNKSWNGKPKRKARRIKGENRKNVLLNRDGGDCFYCGKPLNGDITEEHLLSLVSGGNNSYGNLVLAHASCNKNVGNISVAEKVQIAIDNRIKVCWFNRLLKRVGIG